MAAAARVCVLLWTFTLHVSVSCSGVWIIRNQTAGASYRLGTYRDLNHTGTGWEWLSGPTVQGASGEVRLIYLDVGENHLWVVNERGQVYCRLGITQDDPAGKGWVSIISPNYENNVRQVTVSSNGHAWAVNDNDFVYYRTASSNTSPWGSDWAPAGRFMKQISAGKAGLWASDDSGQVWYRMGTYGDVGTSGTVWLKVPSLGALGKIKEVVSGDGFALAITEDRKVYRRNGVSEQTPQGDSWYQVADNMKTLDTYGCYFWGLNSQSQVVFADLN